MQHVRRSDGIPDYAARLDNIIEFFMFLPFREDISSAI